MKRIFGLSIILLTALFSLCFVWTKAAEMLSEPSDLGVIKGIGLVILTVSVIVTEIWHFFLRNVNKQEGEK